MNTGWITANPLGCVGACLVWVPVGIWIFMAINAMVMGEVEGHIGFFAIAAAFTMGFFASNPPTKEIGIGLFFVAMGSLIAFPFVRKASITGQLRQIDREVLQRHYDTYRLRPNPGLEFRIAEVAWQSGHVDTALAMAHHAVSQMQPQHFPEEHRALRTWQQITNKDASTLATQTHPCPKCGSQILLRSVVCPNCRADVLLVEVGAQASTGGYLARVLLVFAVITGLMVLIPVTVTALPAVASIPLVLVGLSLGVFVLVKALHMEVTG